MLCPTCQSGLAITDRQGIEIDRGTMCNWAGRSAAWLARITNQMKAEQLSSGPLGPRRNLIEDRGPQPIATLEARRSLGFAAIE